MTVEQLTGVLAAVTTLVVALTALFVQIYRLTAKVDGRLTELLELTRSSSHAAGVLEAKESEDIGSSTHTV